MYELLLILLTTFHLKLVVVREPHGLHIVRIDQASATYGTCAKHGTIFNGTLSELKYSNYDLIKNLIFN